MRGAINLACFFTAVKDVAVHELYYWIALRLVFGVGNVMYRNLLRHFGTPERIFQAAADELRKVEGISSKAVEAILGFKPTSAIDRELELIQKHNATIVTLASACYPENLRHIYDPPPYLYVKGEITGQDQNAVAVIGSRDASAYGLRAADTISRDLAASAITIVSGMARGIDSQAHRAALAAGGRTIAVLGSGLDVVYPAENRRLYNAIASHGAIVSEFPMGTEPNSYNFPARNRIISGLSLGILVVEAGLKSGSLITARLALDQGRDVFAVPGSVYSERSRGAHQLLRSGARLVEGAADILEELQYKIDIYPKPELKSDESANGLGPETAKIYGLLKKAPVHIDEIILRAALPSGRISSILLDLELGNRIRQLPGKRFVRC